MISLDLMKSSEVRITGDQSLYVSKQSKNQILEEEKMIWYFKQVSGNPESTKPAIIMSTYNITLTLKR